MYLSEPLSITLFLLHLQRERPERPERDVILCLKSGDDFRTDKIKVYISNPELFFTREFLPGNLKS